MTTYSIQRPSSEQLIDLHVYLLPRESWNEKYHSSYNESISEAMSAGFVRVWPELTVYHLRTVIDEQLGHDVLPSSYVFLRSVGRCMTQIKPNQEIELKCKSFLPPAAWSPEIVVLEVPREKLAAHQSLPGHSPRHDTTQSMNGMPTHFPQLSNHDRMDPQSVTDFIEQLEAARQERMHKEKEREATIKKAKNVQAKTYERRYKSRDYWKKRYFDEKKRTLPLEEQVNRLKTQMEVMHRKLLNHLEGKKGKGGTRVNGPPSKKNDHKINILKMEHELDEMRRQVDNSRMKLTTEVKLRNQAEAEVRSLKTEVTQRKINLTLTRNQKLAALQTGDKLLAKTPIPAVGQASISTSAKR